MELKFSDQPDDPLPSAGASEAAEKAAAASEPAIPAKSSKAGAGRTSVPWRGAPHGVASQDYIGVLIATVVLVLVIGAFYPNFLEVSNLLDILSQATFVGLLACGMAFLLSMRELDLSVGSI